ncbi:GNAT family N-acetyltransferase [Williamsia sp. CHRR-6]|uniref:GNAT family N-acetyltransferase n=1 Tax=Williamsia sp. CHRR-6 TaxID=2835871 RepID=UPI001BD95EF3|nr:GNAT family N-acetyltransferase [Williamsia sp. CHRR-6]MBT0566310.1 GNAT family N-acetyltransferase [Williamsia sp. CHRR-6]
MTVTLRVAEPGDEARVAVTHVRSWRAGYRDLMSAEALGELNTQQFAARYTFHDQAPVRTILAADESDSVAGFVSVCEDRREESDQSRGELAALYVDPDHWGSGVGVALHHAGLRQLQHWGFRVAVLWVFAANIRARTFYERRGWELTGRSRMYDTPRSSCQLEVLEYQTPLCGNPSDE